MDKRLKDPIVTALAIVGSTWVCFVLKWVGNIGEVNMVYILAVLLVAMYTDGYGWGLIASAAGVIGSNFFFTFPYFKLNFIITGYPLTFVTMFLVAAFTSMLATRAKQQARLASTAEVEKTRAAMLRSVSHDLRTPLTAVIGSSSVLLEKWDKLDEGDRRQLVTGIKDDAEWLLNMVENVLSITRVDGASISVEAQPVEETVANAVARCRSRLAGCEISVAVPQGVVMARMDAALIERVLINLIENAYKHAKPPIRVIVEPVEAGMAAISVSDRGDGIAPERLATIFEAGHGHPPDSARGLGIGLSLCRTIVRVHGGEICCYNREGGGSVFRFTLPAEEEDK